MRHRNPPVTQEHIMTKPKTPAAKIAKTKKPAKAAAGGKPTSKLGQLEAMLRRPVGATLGQMSKALDWQAHSIRGAMSGNLKKKQGLKISASKEDVAERVYRITQ